MENEGKNIIMIFCSFIIHSPLFPPCIPKRVVIYSYCIWQYS